MRPLLTRFEVALFENSQELRPCLILFWIRLADEFFYSFDTGFAIQCPRNQIDFPLFGFLTHSHRHAVRSLVLPPYSILLVLFPMPQLFCPRPLQITEGRQTQTRPALDLLKRSKTVLTGNRSVLILLIKMPRFHRIFTE